MIPVETILIFVAASVALAFAPGPDNIFVLTQSAVHGRKAGFVVTLGLCSGLLVHTAVVSLGVAAIFQRSAKAQIVVCRIAGTIFIGLALKLATPARGRLFSSIWTTLPILRYYAVSNCGGAHRH